jgi:hypothetical protein
VHPEPVAVTQGSFASGKAAADQHQKQDENTSGYVVHKGKSTPVAISRQNGKPAFGDNIQKQYEHVCPVIATGKAAMKLKAERKTDPHPP